MMPGLDLATAKADFEANKASLTSLQKQRDAIGAFEQTAQKNIDIFLEQAGKVVDTGSPLANARVSACIKDGEARLNGSGRLLVRKSGTEPVIRIMAEGENERELREVVREIAAAVRDAAA